MSLEPFLSTHHHFGPVKWIAAGYTMLAFRNVSRYSALISNGHFLFYFFFILNMCVGAAIGASPNPTKQSENDVLPTMATNNPVNTKVCQTSSTLQLTNHPTPEFEESSDQAVKGRVIQDGFIHSRVVQGHVVKLWFIIVVFVCPLPQNPWLFVYYTLVERWSLGFPLVLCFCYAVLIVCVPFPCCG